MMKVMKGNKVLNFIILIVMMLVPFSVKAESIELDIIKYYIDEPEAGSTPDMTMDFEYSSSKTDDVVNFDDVEIKWSQVTPTSFELLETDKFVDGNRYQVDPSIAILNIEEELEKQGYKIASEIKEYVNDILIVDVAPVFFVGANQSMAFHIEQLVVGKKFPSELKAVITLADGEEVEIDVSLDEWREVLDNGTLSLDFDAIVEKGKQYIFECTIEAPDDIASKIDFRTKRILNEKEINDITDTYMVGRDYIEEVNTFYVQFVKVQDALKGDDIDILYDVLKATEDEISLFNEFVDDQKEELAKLLNVESGQEAFDLVFSDWIDANILVAMWQTYNAYLQESDDEEIVKFFVDYMDDFDEMYGDRELTKSFIVFKNLDNDYKIAKKFISKEAEDDKKEEPKVPDTLDNIHSSMIISVISLIGLSGATLYLSKKKAN